MTPELALILACCRWPDGAARRHAIAVAAEQVGDWAAVAALARAHRVEGLVDNGLRSGAIDTPERFRAQLAAAAAEIRAFNFGAIAQTLRIDRALGNAGILAMFLKGLPVGVAAYGTPLLKRSWDIDLFVRPADATAAGTILEGLGYAPRRPPRPLDGAEFARWSVVSKEAEFRAATGITVELHWRLADHPMLIPTIDATAPSCAVTLLGEHRVATLAVALPGGLHWLYWPLRLPLGLMRIVRRRLARAVPQSPE